MKKVNGLQGQTVPYTVGNMYVCMDNKNYVKCSNPIVKLKKTNKKNQ